MMIAFSLRKNSMCQYSELYCVHEKLLDPGLLIISYMATET